MKKYLLYMLAIYGVLTLIFIWNSTTVYHIEYKSATELQFYAAQLNIDLIRYAIILFFVFGFIAAAQAMNPINNKVKRISYLMLPASSFEKYLSRWVTFTLGFIIIFSAIFLLSDATRVLFCSVRYPDINIPFIKFSNLISSEFGYSNEIPTLFTNWYHVFIIICSYFYFQSLFILGTTFWPKNSLVKTFAAGTAIFIAYCLICYFVTSALFSGEEGTKEFSSAMNACTGNMMPKNLSLIFLCIFSLFNWVLAYFRFKESEIIKRW
ncbi:hypothetical protein D0T53_06980 [Dysgonomonas sp. 216]|nr:hypothetical protein [Dysgonomonas sp. 216]NDW18657.1 hypothetical protein [Dysgonomonas sp. 216]